jgi:hypothetical protein
VTDPITELHATRRRHLHVVAAINEALAAVEQNPIARLRLAVANYDLGNDPHAHELATALAASIPPEWARE